MSTFNETTFTETDCIHCGSPYFFANGLCGKCWEIQYGNIDESEQVGGHRAFTVTMTGTHFVYACTRHEAESIVYEALLRLHSIDPAVSDTEVHFDKCEVLEGHFSTIVRDGESMSEYEEEMRLQKTLAKKGTRGEFVLEEHIVAPDVVRKRAVLSFTRRPIPGSIEESYEMDLIPGRIFPSLSAGVLACQRMLTACAWGDYSDKIISETSKRIEVK